MPPLYSTYNVYVGFRTMSCYLGRGVTAARQGVVSPAVGVGIVPQPVMAQTPATGGYILADGPVVIQPVAVRAVFLYTCTCTVGRIALHVCTCTCTLIVHDCTCKCSESGCGVSSSCFVDASATGGLSIETKCTCTCFLSIYV